MGDFVRNRSAKYGLGSYCRPCHRVITKAEQNRLYSGPRNFLLQLRYGITEGEFDMLVRRQGGACAICRKRPAGHVDHCHRTQKVRGVLCFSCNRGLGKFRDSSRLMNRAIRYLNRYSS